MSSSLPILKAVPRMSMQCPRGHLFDEKGHYHVRTGRFLPDDGYCRHKDADGGAECGLPAAVRREDPMQPSGDTIMGMQIYIDPDHPPQGYTILRFP